jgi:hypothetical protein
MMPLPAVFVPLMMPLPAVFVPLMAGLLGLSI